MSPIERSTLLVVPARDVARCPLYRAFAYKHTPTNNTIARTLHSNALTPPKGHADVSRLAPYLHLPMCPLFVPPPPISGEKVKEEEGGLQGCGEMHQHECTATFLQILTVLFETFAFIFIFTRLCCEHAMRYRRIFIVKSR